jgi:hypothetical protein
MGYFSKAQTKYFVSNDLCGAYERYSNARSNWKDHWWEVVQAIWETCKDWAKEYILDPVARTLRPIMAVVAPAACVSVKEVAPQYPEGSQLVYLIRLLDRNGELIWSKVGTTTRSIKKRMAEHIRYYRKDGVASLEVTRVWNCGSLPAEGLESEFRAKYMKKYPGTFRKNDRFAGVEFDLEEADRIVENYLMGA